MTNEEPTLISIYESLETVHTSYCGIVSILLQIISVNLIVLNFFKINLTLTDFYLRSLTV